MKRTLRMLLLGAAVAGAAGCGNDLGTPVPDAGAKDAGAGDGARSEGGASEGGAPAEGGVGDAARPAPDAAPELDAPTIDTASWQADVGVDAAQASDSGTVEVGQHDGHARRDVAPGLDPDLASDNTGDAPVDSPVPLEAGIGDSLPDRSESGTGEAGEVGASVATG